MSHFLKFMYIVPYLSCLIKHGSWGTEDLVALGTSDVARHTQKDSQEHRVDMVDVKIISVET